MDFFYREMSLCQLTSIVICDAARVKLRTDARPEI